MGRNELIYCFNFCYFTLTIYLFIIICSPYNVSMVIFEHIHHINLRLSFSNFLPFECVFDCWEDFQINLFRVSVPFIPPENTIKPLVLFFVLGEYNGKETFRLSYQVTFIVCKMEFEIPKKVSNLRRFLNYKKLTHFKSMFHLCTT